VSRIRKKTFYLQFCMRTSESQQKSVISTLKAKKRENSHGIADLTQNHKKIIETPIGKPNLPIKTKKISKKSIFSFSKVKRGQIFVWEATRRNLLGPKS
jgi:hypothetical protein